MPTFIWLLAGAIFLTGFFFLLRCRKMKGRRSIRLTFFLSPFKISGTNIMLQLTTLQQAAGQVNPVDRKGNPAQVEAGTVEFSIDNEDVATVEEDPNDETKFIVKAKGPGVATLTVSADADLGDGVQRIETFSAIEVIPEGAVGFGLTFSAPEDQTLPEPGIDE